jgi:hypothetical protein
MITNKCQLEITKKWILRFEQAIKSFDIKKATKHIGSKILAKAELVTLKSELKNLKDQVKQYEK